jgi:hypothetical protein
MGLKVAAVIKTRAAVGSQGNVFGGRSAAASDDMAWTLSESMRLEKEADSSVLAVPDVSAEETDEERWRSGRGGLTASPQEKIHQNGQISLFKGDGVWLY